MNKIIIFGSSGFIGKNLTEYLGKKEKFILLTPTTKECDLLDLKKTREFVKKQNPDFIINTAYIGVNSNIKYSNDYLFNNLKITTNILRAAKEAKTQKKIIFFGSGLEYRDSKEPISEDFPIRPKNTYAAIKAMNSVLSLNLAQELNLPLILLKPFNLYGSYDIKNVIYYIIKSIQGKKEFCITKGEQIRDYLFVKDFVNLIHLILENNEKFNDYEVFNIGSGEGVKLREVFELIFELMKINPKYKIVDYRKNDYFYQVSDIKKIQNLISWKKETSLEQGLEETIDWIRKS